MTDSRRTECEGPPGQEEDVLMEVREGDVLICRCESCDVELTVTKACAQGACGDCMDIQVQCCGMEMVKKPG